MTTTYPDYNKPARPARSFFGSAVSNWIKAYLPRRIKRMIFLASVTSVVAAEADNSKIAQKLNSVLHIAYKDDATILPMYIKKWIWKDLLKNPYIHIHVGKVPVHALKDHVLTDDDYSTVGAFFQTLAPDWLVYGSEALVIQDMKAVFGKVLAKT